MLNSKQRSYLKKMAADLPDTLFVGKDGLSENIIKQAKNELTARELVKGKIQSNSAAEVHDVAETIASETNSDVVATIGRKFILFLQKEKDSAYTLPKRP